MSEVIRVLRREHSNIATLLKTLEWQASRLEQGADADYQAIACTIDWFLTFPDVCHHPKEDLVFARLQQRDREAAERIGDLRVLHELLAAQVRDCGERLRAALAALPLTGGSLSAFIDAVRGFIRLQVDHMRMEEEMLFPAALATLTAEDWSDLEATMRNEEDPLFGDDVDEHFERLRQMILSWQPNPPHTGDAPR